MLILRYTARVEEVAEKSIPDCVEGAPGLKP